MPKVDAGGRWHATIPGKGNRWLPMPDVMLGQLNDLIERQAGNEKIRRDFKDLGLRTRNVGRMLAKGDVAGAQAKVQTLVDKFPWASFADLVEANPNEELGQVDKLEEGLQAFLDVDPDDFLDLVGKPAKAAPVEAPKEVSPWKAWTRLSNEIHGDEPLHLDDPRLQAWDAAHDNMADSKREMGASFPVEHTDGWYELFLSSYYDALQGFNDEKILKERFLREDEENRRLEAEEAAAAAPEPKPAEVNFKSLMKRDYRNLGISAYDYFQYGGEGFPEHLLKRGVYKGEPMGPDDPKFGQAAMAFYVGEGNGGDYINQALRGTLKDLVINPWKPEERMPEDQQARTIEIAEALEKYVADNAVELPEDSMLYRGIELKALEQLDLTPGAQIPMSGLFSTSASRSIGEDFANRRKWVKSGKPGALIEIETPKGSKVTAAHVKEQELILQPGDLEIVSVDTSGKVPVIRAIYKPEANAKDDKKGPALQSDDPKPEGPSASKKAYEDVRKTVFMGTPLPLDDPRQRAWDSAQDNMVDSEREMGKDFPDDRSNAWYDLFMSSYETALEMHKEEKAAEDLLRQQQEEAESLEPVLPPSAPKRDVRPAGWLKEQFDKGYRRDNEAFMPQGNKGIVELGYLADGTKVVRKKAKTINENDREVVSARIAQIMGIDFHAEKVDAKQVIMNFVEGDVGSTWARNQHRLIPLNPDLDKYDALFERSKKIAAAATELPNAKEIGLLDYLIGNEDRHDGNWILGEDGKMYPIDHGLAQFSDQTDRVPSEKAMFYGSDFTQTSLGAERDAFGFTGTWDPSQKWTHQELEDIKTGLTNLRYEREVRSRKRWIDEALKRIDIVIAKMPPKPEPEVVMGQPLSPPEPLPEPEVEVRRSDVQLRSAFEEGYTPTEDKIFQGNTATVEIGVVADGTQVVRKVVKQEKEADTEYLAGLVANTLGVGPVTAKVGPNEIVMEYVADAKTGNGWFNTMAHMFKPDRNLMNGRGGWEKAERDRYVRMQQHMVEMPGGKEIGMLDWLIDNGDRHAGNWMIKDEQVIPIDHGNARWHPMRYPDEKTGKEMELFNGSPFAEYWLGAKLTRFGELRRMDPQKHWTNRELADIRSKLQDLRDDFTDHPDWHDAIMAKIDRVLEKVKQ